MLFVFCLLILLLATTFVRKQSTHSIFETIRSNSVDHSVLMNTTLRKWMNFQQLTWSFIHGHFLQLNIFFSCPVAKTIYLFYWSNIRPIYPKNSHEFSITSRMDILFCVFHFCFLSILLTRISNAFICTYANVSNYHDLYHSIQWHPFCIILVFLLYK